DRFVRAIILRNMRVLELYSGIGGMRYAVRESNITAEVTAAVDINTMANRVYQHNFPNTRLLQRNIESFTADEINSYNIDMIVMSPPCQPFTRVGLKKDLLDNRSCSFSHLLKIFPQLKPNWRYLLVENVKGFESSAACQQLLDVLCELQFSCQQFILSPCAFSIPNTRHRYYLVAKRRPLCFFFPLDSHVMESLPDCIKDSSTHEKLNSLISKHSSKVRNKCFSLSHILETDKPAVHLEQFCIPDKILGKHASVLDIVGPESERSCCFTKAYSRYAEGTGSVLCSQPLQVVADCFEKCVSGSDEHLEVLRSLKATLLYAARGRWPHVLSK
ncbi:hypothetical protein L9F63_018112, partial [Diploptera punctata]